MNELFRILEQPEAEENALKVVKYKFVLCVK
jgi:hypothetical protein